MEKVFSDVENLKKKYSRLWEETNGELVFDIPEYSMNEKQKKEGLIDNSLSIIIPLIKAMPHNESKLHTWKEPLKEVLKKESKVLLDIKNKELQKNVVDEFMEVADEFIVTAREFDNNMEFKDIMQAIRNVWIMNLIQVISNKPIEHTKSIFAYSMLYPYTDNYLDNPEISNKEKIDFNERLEKRIKGEEVLPQSPNEEKLYKLLGKIEEQYVREEHKNLYDSIIAIHKAQCKSLLQQRGSSSPNKNDIVTISAEKGGTSVLADAYLVCGEVEDELTDLIFGFGFVLQLVDDLQDVNEDLKNNHMTIFSLSAKTCKLDEITNKLIAFTYKTLEFEKYNVSPYILDIKELIIDNTLMLLYEAVSRNKKLYKKAFMKNIESYFPVRFSYLSKTNRKLKKLFRNLKLSI